MTLNIKMLWELWMVVKFAASVCVLKCVKRSGAMVVTIVTDGIFIFQKISPFRLKNSSSFLLVFSTLKFSLSSF